MTEADVIRWAEEAGFAAFKSLYNENAVGRFVPASWLTRFATLVRAQALEDAAAKIEDSDEAPSIIERLAAAIRGMK